jgi:hypothetical protein
MPTRVSLVLCALLASPFAWADDDLDDFEFDDAGAGKKVVSTGGGDDEGEDPEFDDPSLDVPAMDDEGDGLEDIGSAPPPARAAAEGPARGLGVDVAGKQPLADNFPIRVVSTDMGSVVLELPVLVSRSPDDVGAQEFWVVGEVLVDGKKVTETRALVNLGAVAELGPSVVWLKAFAPVGNPSGQLAVRVSKALGAGAPAVLFTRSGTYKL